MTATVTLIPMAAQNGSPAKLDSTQDTSLPQRDRCAMNLLVLGAVVAEDIR
jgi:hypothetical protein